MVGPYRLFQAKRINHGHGSIMYNAKLESFDATRLIGQLEKLSLLVPVLSNDPVVDTGIGLRSFHALDIDIPEFVEIGKGQVKLFRDEPLKVLGKTGDVKKHLTSRIHREMAEATSIGGMFTIRDLRLLCPNFGMACDLTEEVMRQLHKRNIRYLAFFTGLRGFRVLVWPDQPLWFRVQCAEGYGDDFRANHAAKYWDSVGCPQIGPKLDANVYDKGKGLKPDMMHHPDSKLAPQPVDLETLNDAPLTHTLHEGLREQIRSYWTAVLELAPPPTEAEKLPLLRSLNSTGKGGFHGPIGFGARDTAGVKRSYQGSVGGETHHKKFKKEEGGVETVREHGSDMALAQCARGYYRDLAPLELLWKLLTRGDPQTGGRREFAITLPGGTMIRHHGFESHTLWRDHLTQRFMPVALHTGPIRASKLEATGKAAEQPRVVGRELVFDIDIDAYDRDESRRCCKGKKCCKQCWKLVVAAADVIDSRLDQMGWSHRLYVYSGSRGLHVWVLDREACSLSESARAALVNVFACQAPRTEVLQWRAGMGGSGPDGWRRGRSSSFSVQEGEAQPEVQVLDASALYRIPPMPHEEDAARLVFGSFASMVEARQWPVPSPPEWIYQRIVRCATLQPSFGDRDSAVKLDQYDAWAWQKACLHRLDITKKEKGVTFAGEPAWTWLVRTVLSRVAPRLDAAPTVQVAHLVKTPMSVHGGSKKPAVVLSREQLSTFDPASVPTVEELSKLSIQAARSRLQPYVDVLSTAVTRLMLDP
jgi:DNA primase small subunit